MSETLYTTKQVAEELGVTPATVNVWVSRGYLTPVGKKGRQNTFRLSDVFEAERCNRWRSPLLIAALDPERTGRAQEMLANILATEASGTRGKMCRATYRPQDPKALPVRCTNRAPQDAPTPLCVVHLADTYLYVRDLIEAARMTTATGPTRQSVVYFIQRGDRIKIGYSTNLTTRLRALKGDRVLLALPGSRAHESALHELFKAHRIEGEWFRPDAEIMEFIASRADSNVAA